MSSMALQSTAAVGSSADVANGVESENGIVSASLPQAKKTLEAHISETDRRIQEASKLGTALVEQRNKLSERLRDVEQHQDGSVVGQELKQKLEDLEREYNEVGKDAARAFLPKSRQPSGEGLDVGVNRSLVADGNSSDTTAAQFMPSRKQRNQASTRIHDIEFATEISTSLLGQVRHLQSVLAEKEEALRKANTANAQLQADAEHVAQKLKNLDDNEQKFKDENWHLETQLHDLVAQLKEAATREQRLTANLQSTKQEKNTVEREYTELRESHAKLNDDHATLRRTHDTEVTSMKRNLATGETENSTLRSKIDELMSQNSDLAKAVASNVRSESFLLEHADTVEDEESREEQSTPEHSRPSSPTKGTPRHGGLESETLKTSIHHAHRMIQNLKNTIHREKTEKIELRRMLQDARDELETRRAETGAGGATAGRKKKATAARDGFKKPARPDQLGGVKGVREEISSDPTWEDYEASPTRPRRGMQDASTDATNDSDAFQTANERDSNATETDTFHTGAESLGGDSSDELTETEASRPRVSTFAASRTNRVSFMSSASDDFDNVLATPPSGQSQYRSSLLRGGLSQSNNVGGATDSPASFVSNGSLPATTQNLAAELEDFDGDDSSVAQSTPGRMFSSRGASPETENRRDTVIAPVSFGKAQAIQMVDAATLTEPWTPPSTTTADNNSTEPAQTNRNTESVTSHSVEHAAPILPVVDSPASPSAPREFTARSIEQDPSPEPQAQTLSMSKFSTEHLEPVEPTLPNRPSSIDETTLVPTLPTKSAARLSWVRENFNLPGFPPSSTVVANDSEPAATTEPIDQDFWKGREDNARAAASADPFTVDSIENPKTKTKTFATPAAVSDVQSLSTPFQTISGNARQVPATSANVARSTGGENSEAVHVKMEDSPPLRSDHVASNDAGQSPSHGISDVATTMDPFNMLLATSRDGDGYALPDMPNPKSPKRPSSAGSARRGTSTPPRPPLPPDHKELIAAASRNSSMVGLAASPIIPAPTSRTPSQQFGIRGLNDANPIQSNAKLAFPLRSRASSTQGRGDSAPGTRRSSVSSFASEVEERFSINRAAYSAMDGFDFDRADPRMIQAITQTMIGEFLWKYTRKAGRGEHSENRHRRFFWIHPYTRTLYWSSQDPSKAGRQELKAKSVAIEAVRVVTDENPMPPGIHQKSIVVVTPGRSIKFTAPTSQRHETWFNALSYLLLRSEPEPHVPRLHPSAASTRARSGQVDRSNTMSSLTAEDLSEFDPAFYNRSQSRLTTPSRGPMSSPISVKHASASTRAQSKTRVSVPSSVGKMGQSLNRRQSSGFATSGIGTAYADSGASPSTTRYVERGSLSSEFKKPTQPASLVQGSTRSSSSKFGSISSRFRPASGTGFLNLRNRKNPVGGVADEEAPSRPGSERRGSAQVDEQIPLRLSEDVVGTSGKRRRSDAIENVRACCDGKHDVGSLAYHAAHHGRPASIGSRNSFSHA